MQCQATTQKGIQCSRNAKDGSKYCGIHGSASGRKKRTSNTRSSSKTNGLVCSKCGSRSVRALSVIWENGVRPGGTGAFITSRGTVGVGASGTRISASAQRAAPPERYQGSCLSQLVVGGLGIAGLVGCTVQASSGKTGAGLLIFFVLFGIAMWIYMASGWAEEQEAVNSAQDREWENSYRCSRCGTQFTWYG